jgi:hypothetical protein
MATTISVTKRHNLTQEEAKERGHKLVERFHERYGSMISEVVWNAEKTQGAAKGKIFTATFSLTDGAINVEVELRGMGARLIKGQLEAGIKKSLERRFS